MPLTCPPRTHRGTPQSVAVPRHYIELPVKVNEIEFYLSTHRGPPRIRLVLAARCKSLMLFIVSPSPRGLGDGEKKNLDGTVSSDILFYVCRYLETVDIIAKSFDLHKQYVLSIPCTLKCIDSLCQKTFLNKISSFFNALLIS